MMLIFSVSNWLLEIYKWKLLASSVKKISFFESYVQSLSAHTLSLFTPFKTGEFGVKTMFYERSLLKKILELNFIGNLSQLLITVLFGIIGFYYYQYSIVEQLKIPFFDFENSRFVSFTMVILISILLFKIMNQLINFSIISFKNYFKIIGISNLRYLIFSHQYLLLLLFFYPNLNYLPTISAIFSMYLLASIVPTLALFDWTIKGSIALLLFSVLGFQVEIILMISVAMWVFNFAIPAILGSYLVLTLTSNKILINE